MRLPDRIIIVAAPFLVLAYFVGLVAWLKEERRAAEARRIPDLEYGPSPNTLLRREHLITTVRPKDRGHAD